MNKTEKSISLSNQPSDSACSNEVSEKRDDENHNCAWNSLCWTASIILCCLFISLCINILDFSTEEAAIRSWHIIISLLSTLITLGIFLVLANDYLKHRYAWIKGWRTHIIPAICLVGGSLYVCTENTTILPCFALIVLMYVCYIKTATNQKQPQIIESNTDLLYRSRLFNRTHLQIRKLAYDNTKGLTIGICGQWGSGKTFFINNLLANLSQQSTKSSKNGPLWEKPFVVCEKVELWSASSLDDAWERVIFALHKGIFDKEPLNIRWLSRLPTYLFSFIIPSHEAAHELISLVLPDFHNDQLRLLKERMHERKIVLVFDDLERADFSIIQAMLPLFERLKKLPNLIVICAVAEEELKRVFLRERVLPDFVQGHLAKLFDLRIEIPTMSHTAIENFQNNLFSSKYKDCPLVKSFLTKYPLRFDSARQMIRVIDRLTSIERQYYANCPFSFNREPEDEQNSILAQAKYIFLIETLRLVNPALLKELYEKPHYSNTLNKIPYTLLATSSFEITEDAHERYDFILGISDNNRRKIENEDKWAETNKKLYTALIQKATEWSIFSYLYKDVYAESESGQHKRESYFSSAYDAYYTRCTSLLEWEMQQISESPEMQGIPYHEKVSIHFHKLNEHPEPKFLSAAEFSLFDYEIRQAKGNNEKIKQVISSLQKETREIGNIYGNSRIHSSYFWRTLAHLGFNSTNDDFDYSSHAPLFLLLFDVMSLDEQAYVLSAFFHRYKTEITSGEKSDLENHVDWLSHDSNYKNLVEQMSYKYGCYLAFYINNYPKHFSSVSQEYACQVYDRENHSVYWEQIRKGVSDYIQSCSNIEQFIFGWLGFMGHQYRDASMHGGINSSFISNGVAEMMKSIEEMLNLNADTIAHLPNKSKIRLACSSSLENLRKNYNYWSEGEDEKRKAKYSSGTLSIIQMIEEIQKAATFSC